MKNKVIKTIAAGAVAMQFMFPVVAAAQDNGDEPTMRPPGRAREQIIDRVCEAISGQTERIEQRIVDQQDRLAEKRANRDANLIEHQDKRLDRMVELRSAYDERHTERLELLLSKTDDADVTAAINEFEDALQVALSARRAAYDAAIEKYRAGVDAAVASHRSKVDAAGDQLNAAISAAVANAEAACEGEEVDLAAIRTAMRDAIKAAREQFRTSMDGLTSLGDEIQSLVDARNVEFEAARDAFRSSVEAARDKLRSDLELLRVDDDVDGAQE